MNKVKILYVEDEQSLALIVADSLEDHGFDVVHRENGQEALSYFKKESADVIVLDVMMPLMDGFTAAAEIRKTNPHVPILFLSALTQTEDVVKGFHMGANDYIRKPFKIEELIVRIEALSRRVKRPVHASYEIGDYVLDTNKNILTHASAEEKLSYREVELIRRLFENKDNVVPREDIIKAYWGDDTYFTGRSLDVFISRIRKYFAQDGRIKITNVRGIGYIMNID
ncbi:response regulator transcription factor [Sphingobacterium yanglingense]|uniref:DNA-binding response OmpR family regulator n=1 Tax=Sphingobacterium yanglingense TaxID=1437280 RepID=A0A4R6WCI2_9SPHI|nr:response regulator transcription factor [Sphingobacterium yanglingense]TDQ75454.1 DNA-binding response OmpR family regulator [Sphingobacterium yanglingense]